MREHITINLNTIKNCYRRLFQIYSGGRTDKAAVEYTAACIIFVVFDNCKNFKILLVKFIKSPKSFL